MTPFVLPERAWPGTGQGLAVVTWLQLRGWQTYGSGPGLGRLGRHPKEAGLVSDRWKLHSVPEERRGVSGLRQLGGAWEVSEALGLAGSGFAQCPSTLCSYLGPLSGLAVTLVPSGWEPRWRL